MKQVSTYPGNAPFGTAKDAQNGHSFFVPKKTERNDYEHEMG